MGRIEKTVFISYRRTNAFCALAISQNLTQFGYDVFFDFNGIASGDFEQVIFENIRARAHFLVLLTPSALERCAEPGDLLRREIEMALETKRNIVPLMLEGFDFAMPRIASQLTGTLALLPKYNALSVPVDYFDVAMDRLRTRWLNVPLDGVSHPASATARSAAKEQQAAAASAPPVSEKELTAEEWFERAFYASDSAEKISLYDQAIRLKPDFAEAFNSRGDVRKASGDLNGALLDYDEAIRLKPSSVTFVHDRAAARAIKGDMEGAHDDYSTIVRLSPNNLKAFRGRGAVRLARGDLAGALHDYDEAIRLKGAGGNSLWSRLSGFMLGDPSAFELFTERGTVRRAMGDLEEAQRDFDEAARLGPKFKK